MTPHFDQASSNQVARTASLSGGVVWLVSPHVVLHTATTMSCIQMKPIRHSQRPNLRRDLATSRKGQNTHQGMPMFSGEDTARIIISSRAAFVPITLTRRQQHERL